MKKIFILIIVLSTAWIQVISQESITLRISEIDVTEKSAGDTLLIPVYCDEVSDVITGWQFYLLFDENVIEYVKINFKQSDMIDDWFENSLGYMWAASWLDPTFKGIGLYPGEKIFELVFVYTGGNTKITWGMESISEEGKLVKGETMVVDGSFKPFELNLVSGCICKKGN